MQPCHVLYIELAPTPTTPHLIINAFPFPSIWLQSRYAVDKILKTPYDRYSKCIVSLDTDKHVWDISGMAIRVWKSRISGEKGRALLDCKRNYRLCKKGENGMHVRIGHACTS